MPRRIRSFQVLAAVAAVALAGCSSALVREGPDPNQGIGIRLVVKASGEGEAQALADQFPLTALLRWRGNISLTARPSPPFLIYDGDSVLIVEPTPGRENEALKAVASGHVLIRRSGVPGLLNSPGTIASMNRAAQPMPNPQPPPPPEPISLSTSCKPGDPDCDLNAALLP